MVNFDRYTRNIALELVGKEGQKKLFSSHVLVAGAGGLGSTVIANLASMGIGHIGIVDNDILELSNLNRQYIHKLENIHKPKVASAKEWINSFNPDIKIDTYPIRLNSDNYEDVIDKYDFVVDCFDSYKSKFLLNDICIKSDKTLIHGGISEFSGQVTVIKTNETPCLRCLVDENDYDSYIPKGILSPAASTIASVQSMELAKLVLGIGHSLENRLLVYDGLKMEFRNIKISKNSMCSICGQIKNKN